VSLFGFGRKKPPSAAERLASGRWQCAKCDEWHSWPFDIAAIVPDPWRGERVFEPNGALRLDGDFLSEDFCVMGGEYFMVRAVLPIPVNGVEGDFFFGCWTTLSRANFDIYTAGFDSGEYADMGPWTGWLMNRPADFIEGKDPLPIWVEPQPNRQRPHLWVRDDDEPLAVAQSEGISPERMLEIFAYYGHGVEG